MSPPTREQASSVAVAIAGALADRFDHNNNTEPNWDVLVDFVEDELDWNWLGPILDDLQADFEQLYPDQLEAGKEQK